MPPVCVQFNDVCFGGAPLLAEVEKLFSVFPTMDLHFDVSPGPVLLLQDLRHRSNSLARGTNSPRTYANLPKPRDEYICCRCSELFSS